MGVNFGFVNLRYHSTWQLQGRPRPGLNIFAVCAGVRNILDTWALKSLWPIGRETAKHQSTQLVGWSVGQSVCQSVRRLVFSFGCLASMKLCKWSRPIGSLCWKFPSPPCAVLLVHGISLFSQRANIYSIYTYNFACLLLSVLSKSWPPAMPGKYFASLFIQHVLHHSATTAMLNFTTGFNHQRSCSSAIGNIDDGKPIYSFNESSEDDALAVGHGSVFIASGTVSCGKYRGRAFKFRRCDGSFELAHKYAVINSQFMGTPICQWNSFIGQRCHP